jgi:hypothetical protein
MRGGSISDFREKDGKRWNAEKKRREDGEEKKALLCPFQTPSSSVVLI